MFYVGIDQHKRHLTICVRNEQGDVALRRQVATGWLEVDRFLESLQDRCVPEGGYVAIMEVCGFNDWLLKRLARWGCTQVYVIAAPPRLRNKTDRRDSAKLSELLWINRERIATGSRLVNGWTMAGLPGARTSATRHSRSPGSRPRTVKPRRKCV